MLCGKCGAYFGKRLAAVVRFCRKCDEHFYDRAFALGIYEKALAASVIALKNSPLIPRRISNFIKARVDDLAEMDLIVPIPLSKERLLERGFNQAEIVAREIANVTRAKIDTQSLVRHQHTKVHRMGMDQKARELSVRNSFSVLRPKLIAEKNILLVDDVFTSGATASNCAKVLKKNGALQVNVFTLARAVMN